MSHLQAWLSQKKSWCKETLGAPWSYQHSLPLWTFHPIFSSPRRMLSQLAHVTKRSSMPQHKQWLHRCRLSLVSTGRSLRCRFPHKVSPTLSMIYVKSVKLELEGKRGQMLRQRDGVLCILLLPSFLTHLSRWVGKLDRPVSHDAVASVPVPTLIAELQSHMACNTTSLI